MRAHPYNVVREFEQGLAEFCGSKYAVTTDSCSSALLLCCARYKVKTVTIPARTYPSVPCSIIHAGGRVQFLNEDWRGIYQLKPWPIYDAAKRFRRGMYISRSSMCLSFHSKKLLPIGRGGAILTDDKDAAAWFKRARFDGREECALSDQKEFMVGWNCYMQPEQAARGLVLLSMVGDGYEDQIEDPPYPDLSLQECYR